MAHKLELAHRRLRDTSSNSTYIAFVYIHLICQLLRLTRHPSAGIFSIPPSSSSSSFLNLCFVFKCGSRAVNKPPSPPSDPSPGRKRTERREWPSLNKPLNSQRRGVGGGGGVRGWGVRRKKGIVGGGCHQRGLVWLFFFNKCTFF